MNDLSWIDSIANSSSPIVTAVAVSIILVVFLAFVIIKDYPKIKELSQKDDEIRKLRKTNEILENSLRELLLLNNQEFDFIKISLDKINEHIKGKK